jgi:hypothetical protein
MDKAAGSSGRRPPGSATHHGDDTPWSKAFLASAYASRGIKVRFTSGSGSEALMGHSEGKSMIYLETHLLMAVKGGGSQGVQNGSISCIALPEALPDGVSSHRTSGEQQSRWPCRKCVSWRFTKPFARGGRARQRFSLSPRNWKGITKPLAARE